MRKEAGLLCLFTSVFAVGGFAARRLQLNSAFEPETGLPVKGAPISMVLLALCAVFALALFFLVRRHKDREISPEFRVSLRGKTILYPVAATVFGAAMIGGTVLLITTAKTYDMPVLQIILAVLCAGTGIAFPVLAMGPKKESRGVLMCFFSAVPVVFYCFWLIISYKNNSSDPVLWNYCFEILAVAAATLGFYYTAGFAFEKPKPLANVYFANLAAFFAAVRLADFMSLPFILMFAGGGLMLMAVSFVLVENYGKKRVSEPAHSEPASSESVPEE